MSIGIYKIENIINKKTYIGSSINVEKRWNSHKNKLKNNKHHSKKLQNSWNKHGEDNFIFSIVELLENSSNILEREQFYINLYESYKHYNICKFAYSRLQYKHTDITKEKIRISNTGKVRTNFSKLKMSQSAIERYKKNKISIETRIKISNSKKNKPSWNKGIKISDETKNKISKTLRGRTSPQKGKKLSLETRKKMSDSHKKVRHNISISLEKEKEIIDLHKNLKLSDRKIAHTLKLTRGLVRGAIKRYYKSLEEENKCTVF
jgi:group I intron endonuclease